MARKISSAYLLVGVSCFVLNTNCIGDGSGADGGAVDDGGARDVAGAPDGSAVDDAALYDSGAGVGVCLQSETPWFPAMPAGAPWFCAMPWGPGVVVAHACESFIEGGTSVVGWFSGEAVFAPGTPQETAVVADGVDGFIAEFDAEGAFVEIRTIGGSGNQRAVSCGTDGEGLLVVGLFGGMVEAGGQILTAVSQSDVFGLYQGRFADQPDLRHLVAGEVTAVSLSTQYAVVRRAGFSGALGLNAEFRGEITVLPGGEEETVLVSHGGTDIFSVGFGGLFVVGGPGDERLGDSAVYGDSSSIGNQSWAKGGYFVGSFSDGAIFYEGTADEFVATSNGGLDIFVAWQHRVTRAPIETRGGPGDDLAYYVVSGSNMTVVVGTYEEGAQLLDERSLQSMGASDLFALLLSNWDSSGSVVTAGSPARDVPLRISVDADYSLSMVNVTEIFVQGAMDEPRGALVSPSFNDPVNCEAGVGFFELRLGSPDDEPPFELTPLELSGGCASTCEEEEATSCL